ncbi:MAG: DUF4974 domain-containing protein [Sphingobacterium sp.]|jgi:ferric-dicitrate binding protein FerR (iron transport regulator)|nr:DUF4974 domain-containing protein [Sphingobacterium sp.]
MKDDLKIQRIQELSRKILDRTISAEELKEYDQWYTSYDDYIVEDMSAEDLQMIGDRLYQRIDQQKRPARKYLKLIAFLTRSAAVLAICCLAYWTYSSLESINPQVEPLHKQAFVRDAAGNEHNFNELKVGDSKEIGSLSFTKQIDGTIIFTENKAKPVNNEISEVITPKGGEYKICLPDGTLVWMNADTKLEFKTAFTENERHVRIQGEAYFEVKHWLDKPFVVETPWEKIRVLGTKFNVFAYRSDRSATSLTEGTVQIAASNNKERQVILRPGQQALQINHQIVVKNFDRDQVLAWKNGELTFDQVPLEEVTAALARWYDVEFEFENPALKEIPFWGTFSKNERLQEHLSNMEYAKIAKFKLKGRRIIVTK